MQLISALITTYALVLNARFLLVELDEDSVGQLDGGGFNLRWPQGRSDIMRAPSKFKYYY